MRRLACVMMVLVVLGVLGCQPKTVDNPDTGPIAIPGGGETTDAAPPAGEQYSIAIVPKGTTHSFWKTVRAGAEAACAEAGAEALWKGPTDETDVARQIAIIENFITSEVDALVMAACDAKALIPKVKQALEAGIPVITIDSGISSDDALSFVATDNVEGARLVGAKLGELIGGEGKVGCIPFIKGAATSDMREEGFIKGIEEFSGIELVSTLYSQGDIEEAMKATENMLTANPDLKGIFAANEPGVIGAARVIEQRDLADQVVLVGFDAAEAEIEGLESGVIQALAVQNPYQMGYLGVQAAIDAIEGADVEKRIDTGVVIVTPENLQDDDVQTLLNPDLGEE